jgi:hypothetical protein
VHQEITKRGMEINGKAFEKNKYKEERVLMRKTNGK